MFCVAAEIPLHGLSSSFPFSFSLAILLLSNQLAHAGRAPHGPAVPAHRSEEAWEPPLASIPPRDRERMQLPAFLQQHHGQEPALKFRHPGFAGSKFKMKEFSLCTRTLTR